MKQCGKSRRSIIFPAELLIKWAPGLDDSGIVLFSQEEQIVYLLPQFENHKMELIGQRGVL